MGAPKRMSDVDVDAGKTPHPDADRGKIPESEWLPMIPFSYDWMDRPVPRYEGQPCLTEAQLRRDIRESCKRHGVPQLSKEEVDALVAGAGDLIR
jgi:hypothetical protein